MRFLTLRNCRRPAYPLRYLWLLFILSPAALFSTEPWPLPLFLSEPKAALQAAEQRPASNADAVVLDYQIKFRVDENGRISRLYRMILRPLTDAGAKQCSVFSHAWLSWRQDKPRLRTRVITADGTAHDLDTATITEAGIPTALQGVFTDAKLLSAPLPAVAPGVLIETESETNDREVLNPEGSIERYSLPFRIPIQHLVITIEAPASAPLRVAVRGLSNVHRTEEHAAALQKVMLEASDLPVREPLPLAGSDVAVAPEVVFSTSPAWQQVASWYAQVVDRQIETPQPPASGEVRLAEVEAILAEIQKTVRYTGVELGLAAYVPRSPQETLARGYGDCKDKSALLAARLRRAGIRAELALLAPYPATEIVPDVPGIEAFSHAIVYVPGRDPLWIDPTSEFTPARRLPWADQGRLALIVNPQTTELVRTPESAAADNRTTTTYTVRLVDEGKPGFIKTREASGVAEDFMRAVALRATQLSDEQKKSEYTRMAKLLSVERLINADWGSPTDLGGPARMILEAEGYLQAAGSEQSAYVYIPQRIAESAELHGLLEGIAPEDKSSVKKVRTEDYCVPYAFTLEDRWKIVPPPGFTLMQLPTPRDIPMGPFTLQRRASAQADHSLLFAYTLEVPKRCFTMSEAAQLSKAFASANAQRGVRLEFLPEGARLMADGKWKEGFGLLRRDALSQPPRVPAKLRYASALLQVGLRDLAVEECRKAIQIDPKSARAYEWLAWVLRHDPVGRLYFPGMRLKEADEAIRKAVELDSNDKHLIAEEAIIKEWEPSAERYADASNLADAIKLLEPIAADLPNIGEQDLLPSALFYARRFSDVQAFYDREEGRTAPADFRLAAIAAADGVDAAIRESETLVDRQEQRKENLRRSGQDLIYVGEYEKAADLLQAGAADGDSSHQSDAELLRHAHRRTEIHISNDPVIAVVQRYIFALFDSDAKHRLDGLLSPESRLLTYETQRSALFSLLTSYSWIAGQNLSTRAMADIAVSNIEFKSEGDDATGYRVRFADPAANGAMNTLAWVVKYDGSYKILGLRDDSFATGAKALELVSKGNLDAARRWLNWQRDEFPDPSGTDVLDVNPLLRLWPPPDGAPDRDRIIAAAASLVALGPDGRNGIEALNDVRDRGYGDSYTTWIDLAIAEALSRSGRFDESLPVWQRLYQVHPSSSSAFTSLGAAMIGGGRTDMALKLTNSVRPDEPHYADALRLRGRAYQAQQKFAEAAQVFRELCSSSHALGADWNNLAWLTLYAPGVMPPDLKAAETAVRLTQERDRASIHTLSTVQADVGKLKQSRDMLLRYLSNDEHIGDEVWYVLARMAEQLELEEVALQIYSKITKPEQLTGDSVYELAQIRRDTLRVVSGESISKKR